MLKVMILAAVDAKQTVATIAIVAVTITMTLIADTIQMTATQEEVITVVQILQDQLG